MLTPSGHAIECRIYAEDPDSGFLPSPGRIQHLRAASGPGIRDDSGASAGLDVPIFYDPMIAKLVAWGEDRPRAIARMQRALSEYVVGGIKTTIPFFRWLLAEPVFAAGQFHTTYLDEVLKSRNGQPFSHVTGDRPEEAAEIAAMAVAVHTLLAREAAGASAGRGTAASSAWKAQARMEGRR
jgi:acetyl-CoA carboxylase biotin carboxylase subunit